MGDDNVNEQLFYWSLDISGMTTKQGLQVVSAIKASAPFLDVLLVDPTKFLTLHLDRESVEAIVEGLAGVRLNPVNGSLRESLEEWLTWLGGSSSRRHL